MANTALDILLGVCLTGAVGLLVYWSAAMYQIVRTRRALPTARAGVGAADAKPPTEKVCVIVPAHNEAGTIAGLIASLKAQDYDRMRVVLALDRCTDDTRGVAERAIDRDPRFEIVEITACPADWAGKVHAAWTGFQRSQHAQNAEVLIFTDADTEFDPSCVRACLALARQRRLDMLSLFCTLTTETWFERVVQTAAGFELARQYPLIRANLEDHRRRRPFANGQFMLFDAGAYRAIGGHEGVKEALLEDIAFSRRIAQSQMRGGLLLADGMVRCRMYDDWAQFRRGWKRIYTESANREPGRLRRYAWRSTLLGMGLPVLAVGGLALAVAGGDGATRWAAGGVCAAALVVWLAGLVAVYRSSGARTEDVLYFPLGAWLVGSIYREAWRDLVTGKPTSWGGREYVRPVAHEGGGVV